jgi:uncharacterized damage-inducible protein DinB
MVAGLSQHEFDRRPNPRKWSIGEVLDHLLLFDRFLRYDISRLIDAARSGGSIVIRHSFSDVNVAPAFFPKALLPLVEIPFSFSSRFVPSCLRDTLARSRLIRFQHPDIADPRRGRPADELRQELSASIGTIEKLLLDNADVDFHKLHVQHPLLGDNNVVQLLSFMASHEQRHQGQIADLKHRLQMSRVA